MCLKEVEVEEGEAAEAEAAAAVVLVVEAVPALAPAVVVVNLQVQVHQVQVHQVIVMVVPVHLVQALLTPTTMVDIGGHNLTMVAQEPIILSHQPILQITTIRTTIMEQSTITTTIQEQLEQLPHILTHTLTPIVIELDSTTIITCQLYTTIS